VVVVPLLLLATPGRAPSPTARHHAATKATHARADATLSRGSSSLPVSIAFADLVESVGPTLPATAAAVATSPVRVLHVSLRPALPATTTTAAPARASSPPTPAAPRPTPPVTSVPATTAPRAPTPTAPPPPQHTTTGQASWYPAAPGTCASPGLAFGTVVTVTDLADGASTRCTVDDREATTTGRVIDLSESTFSQLASPSVGVVEVRLTW